MKYGIWCLGSFLVLSAILFGGFRGRSGWQGWRRRRWEAVTPEEREQLRHATHFGRREGRT